MQVVIDVNHALYGMDFVRWQGLKFTVETAAAIMAPAPRRCDCSALSIVFFASWSYYKRSWFACVLHHWRPLIFTEWVFIASQPWPVYLPPCLVGRRHVSRPVKWTKSMLPVSTVTVTRIECSFSRGRKEHPTIKIYRIRIRYPGFPLARTQSLVYCSDYRKLRTTIVLASHSISSSAAAAAAVSTVASNDDHRI